MDRGVASGRPARNETRHVWGGGKKKGRERKNTGTTREPTTGTDRTDPRKSGKPAARVGPPRAPRGGSRHPPPHTTAASGTAAAGGGGSWSLRESRPNDRLPYGPHRPPTLGAAGRLLHNKMEVAGLHVTYCFRSLWFLPSPGSSGPVCKCRMVRRLPKAASTIHRQPHVFLLLFPYAFKRQTLNWSV